MSTPGADRPDGHSRFPLARNAVLNLTGQIPTLVVAVLCMPRITSGLGPDRFGLLALAWVILSYSAVFDLGLTRAATRAIAEAWSMGDRDRVASIVLTTMLAQAVLGLLGIVIFGMIAPLGVERFLHASPALVGEAQRGLRVLALAWPILLVSGAFRGALEAVQRFDLVNAIRIPSSLGVFLLPFLGVTLHWSLPQIIASLVAWRGLALVGFGATYLAAFGLPQHGYRVDGGVLRALVGFGGWVTVSAVVDPVLGYADRFVIGAMAGVASVGYYAAPHEMATRLWLIPGSLVATLFPAFAALDAQRLRATSSRLASRAVKYVLLTVGPIAMVILPYVRQILSLWLGPEYAARSAEVLAILILGVLINSTAQVAFTLLHATGRPDVPARFHLIELPVHLFFLWLFVRRWGIVGAAAAWTTRVTLDAILLHMAAVRLVPVNPGTLLRDRIPQTILALAMLGILGQAIGGAAIAEWMRGTLVAVLIALTGIVGWRYLLDEADRDRIDRVTRAMRRGGELKAHARG